MTALRLPLTLAATFFSSLGAALGLYAAAFIALDNDIDPFMRAIHQAERMGEDVVTGQMATWREWRAWRREFKSLGPSRPSLQA